MFKVNENDAVSEIILMMRFNEKLFSTLYSEALKGSCLHRKYAAAIVKNGMVLGIGRAQTVNGSSCVVCDRMEKIQKYGEISEFFEECPVVHAEVCAILNTNQKADLKKSELYLLGVIVKDGSVYKDAFPCPNCYRMIQYSGIQAINIFQSNMSICRTEVSV